MKINREEILNKLNWRYATKQFDPTKKISKEDWDVLAQSLVLSPSSYGLQPWRFYLVENSDIRAKLKTVSWNQTQVTDASHFVVFTTMKTADPAYIRQYVERTAEVRGVDVSTLAGFENMMVKNIAQGMQPDHFKAWSQRQAYIAMGFLMETAAMLDIDTVALEGLTPAAYDEILNLNGTNFGTVAAVALGYRGSEDKYSTAKKVRFSTDFVIHKV